MKILKTETVLNGNYLTFKRKHFQAINGRKSSWEYIEKKDAEQLFVSVFALTDKKEVILERIFRVPFEKFFIELPSGARDRKGEKEIETAKREFLEETGYKIKKIMPVLRGKITSLSNEEAILYFASEIEFTGKTYKEDVEEIEIIKVPLSKLVDFVLNPPKNTKIDIKILSILPILEKKKLI